MDIIHISSFWCGLEQKAAGIRFTTAQVFSRIENGKIHCARIYYAYLMITIYEGKE